MKSLKQVCLVVDATDESCNSAELCDNTVCYHCATELCII